MAGENVYRYAPNILIDPLGLIFKPPGHMVEWMLQRPSTRQYMEGIEFSGVKMNLSVTITMMPQKLKAVMSYVAEAPIFGLGKKTNGFGVCQQCGIHQKN